MNEVSVKEDIRIEDLIYEICGKPVMLDSDLARLYQCKNGTKEINQAVKNNFEKFPKRFTWKLTDEECKSFLVKNFDQKIETRGGRYKKPRVFTEQGIAMLATILKSDVATQMSIKIMDAFVFMHHYIGNSEYRLSNIETKIIEHDANIQLLQESLHQLEDKRKVNDIYFNGQIYDACSKIQEIFSSAEQKLVIVDAYADNTVLDIVKRLPLDVIIITKPNNLLTKQDVFRYNQQYHNLKVIYNNTFHDRYFIIDDKYVYHCGASINRIGYKTFSITLIGDIEVSSLLIDKINKVII